MYPPGHVGLTAVLIAPLVCWLRLTGRERTAMECLVVALALSLLPDIDTLLPGIVHRGITHTLLAALVVGVGVAVAFRWRSAAGLADHGVGVRWFVGAAGVLSHLAGDVITPMGIRPLFPLFGTGYTLDIVPASSPTANAALLLLGATVLVFTYSVPPLPGSEIDDSTEVSPATRR